MIPQIPHSVLVQHVFVVKMSHISFVPWKWHSFSDCFPRLILSSLTYLWYLVVKLEFRITMTAQWAGHCGDSFIHWSVKNDVTCPYSSLFASSLRKLTVFCSEGCIVAPIVYHVIVWSVYFKVMSIALKLKNNLTGSSDTVSAFQMHLCSIAVVAHAWFSMLLVCYFFLVWTWLGQISQPSQLVFVL